MSTITIDEIWNANGDGSAGSIGGINSNDARAAAHERALAEFKAMCELFAHLDPAETAIYEPADAIIVDELDNPMTNAEVLAAASEIVSADLAGGMEAE